MKNWEKIEAVDKMQVYIEERIEEVITLQKLSKISGYSPWHSSRVFKELTGKNPFDYIRLLRLSNAAIRIRDSKSKIIETAFDFVFDSHEGFTRAFSNYFGMSPKKYRDSQPPIPLFMPSKIINYHSMLRKKGENTMENSKEICTVFTQVVIRPERKLIVRRGVTAKEYFKYCEEVGCEVWGVLCSIKEAIHEPAGIWLPKQMIKTGTSQYVQGVEVSLDYDKKLPEGFEYITLPSCKMMVFNGPKYNDDDFMEAISDLQKAISEFDPKQFGYKWSDKSPAYQLEPHGYRGYIEAKPVEDLD
ncbi:MAG: AraC family transcriptional regulator [Candidatus Delongbacteria bacterium]|nr:AraC family transcriptional regulator [Candidatus Delongbacteria bacterium]MBN2834288.1 AraC family transcriptional regulator [Candidatus Delongbacteria bacterium]